MATDKTYNYALSFRGWAQCRLATDPDPDYEPRGVSGYTFALPGEPDLTQVIHFQPGDGVVRRSHCPEIGVQVDGGYAFETISQGDSRQRFGERHPIGPGHPAYGAAVDLLGQPRFDSRNSTLVYNGYGVVNPFELEVRKGDRSVSRRFYVDPFDPKEDLHEININELGNYVVSVGLDEISAPNSATVKQPSAPTPGSPDMLYESGVLDAVAYRHERLLQLEAELAELLDHGKPNRLAIAALHKRIAELRITDPVNRRTQQMSTKVLLPYALNARQAQLNGKEIEVGAEKPWSLEMWLGSWDADALSFYVLGTIVVSLPEPLF